MTVNMLGIQEDPDSRRTAATWLWPLLPISVAVFCISALIYYHLYHDEIVVASALQSLVATGYRWLGFAPAFIFCVLSLVWSSIWFVTGHIERPAGRLARLAGMTVMLGVFMNVGEGGVTPAFHKGELGFWLADHLVGAIGYPTSLVLVWGITFGSLLLATDFFFSEAFERLRFRGERVEGGVETAVTDHLKGLGATSAPLSPGSASPGFGAVSKLSEVDSSLQGRLDAALEGANAEVDAEVGGEGHLDLELAAEESAVGQPVEQVVEPPAYTPRRRSYFERRYGEANDQVVEPGTAEPPVPAAWMPMAPEAQEIENPEALIEAERHAETEDESAVERPPTKQSAPEGMIAAAPAEEWAAGEDPVAETADFHEGRPRMSVGKAEADEPEELDETEAEFERVDQDEAAERRAFEAADAEDLVWLKRPAAGQAAEGLPGAEARDDRAVDEQAAEERDSAEEANAEALAEEAAGERVVSIPRPEPDPVEVRADALREPARQQRLFGAQIDEALVAEAIETVTAWQRASATFLQRKLRIDYELACQLMVELSARGVVELEADASHGRVLG